MIKVLLITIIALLVSLIYICLDIYNLIIQDQNRLTKDSISLPTTNKVDVSSKKLNKRNNYTFNAAKQDMDYKFYPEGGE